MKTKIFLIAMISVVSMTFVGWQNDDSDTNKMEGPWQLRSIHLYEDNKISDSIVSNDEYKQIKIFSNGKVMWTRYVPKDEDEWFGYGNYEVINGQLIETLEYGSTAMMKVIDTNRVFTFKLEITDNTYSQISVDSKGNYTQAENYVRIGH